MYNEKNGGNVRLNHYLAHFRKTEEKLKKKQKS